MEKSLHGRGNREAIVISSRTRDDINDSNKDSSYKCPSNRGDGRCNNGLPCDNSAGYCIQKANIEETLIQKVPFYYPNIY